MMWRCLIGNADQLINLWFFSRLIMSVERGGFHPEMQRSPEKEHLGSFAELRKAAHQQLEKETELRINENSEPTEDEVLIGAFREMIEPQIRDAVFEMARKGYTTESSGFGGENGEMQSLDGYFEVDEESRKKFEALGVRVLKRKDTNLSGLSEKYSYIQFEPKEADLEKIKTKLDEIVAILPHRDLSATPSISGHAVDFREKFALGRTHIEKETLKKRLEVERYHPDVERQMRERLEELEIEE